MSTDSSPVTLEALAAELAQLKAANTALQEKVSTLEREQEGARAHSSRRTLRQRPDRTSRRRLLQLGGAAAAATVSAGVLLHEQSGTALAAPQHVASTPYEGDATGAGNWGLKGAGTSGAQGVVGTSDSSAGVFAQSSSAAGVFGQSSSGAGVAALSNSGVGVSGSSSFGIGASFTGPQAPLQLGVGVAPGAPTSGTHNHGEIYLDSNVVMWVCVAGGTPGTWKQAVVVPASGTVTLQQSASGNGHTAIEGDATSGGTGVSGTSDTGSGVAGTSTSSGAGVSGTSSGGAGVIGTSANNVGVWGSSTNNVGVQGVSTHFYGAFLNGGLAPLLLNSAGTPGAPSSGTHDGGELYVDSNAILWYCVGGGTPGTWVRLAGVASGASGGATTFLSSPIRLVDTRGGAPITNSNTPLAGGSTLVVQVTGTSVGGISVPAGASAVIGNLTALPFANGDLTIWQDGITRPGVSNLNYTTGINVANFVMAALSPAGKVDIFAHVGSAHVILDVTGYML